MFYRGAELWETLYGFITAYPVVCFVFVPVYCNLGITSVYQYLDLRYYYTRHTTHYTLLTLALFFYFVYLVFFVLLLWWIRFRNKLVKRIASISYIMRNCLSMGVNLYTPCVALNTIAGVPNWLSLFVMTVISIIFTFMVKCLYTSNTLVVWFYYIYCTNYVTLYVCMCNYYN